MATPINPPTVHLILMLLAVTGTGSNLTSQQKPINVIDDVMAFPAIPNSRNVIVYVRELCHDANVSVESIRTMIGTADDRFNFTVLARDEICSNRKQLPLIVNFLSKSDTVGLIGSPAPADCDVLNRLTRVWRKYFVTWTCPAIDGAHVEWKKDNAIRSLIAPVNVLASGVAYVIKEMNWKTIAIISSDEGWWPSLAHAVDLALRHQLNLIAKPFIVIPSEATSDERMAKLIPLNSLPIRVIIICTTLHPLGQSILSTIDHLRIIQRFGTYVIVVDASLLPYVSHLVPEGLRDENGLENGDKSRANDAFITVSKLFKGRDSGKEGDERVKEMIDRDEKSRRDQEKSQGVQEKSQEVQETTQGVSEKSQRVQEKSQRVQEKSQRVSEKSQRVQEKDKSITLAPSVDLNITSFRNLSAITLSYPTGDIFIPSSTPPLHLSSTKRMESSEVTSERIARQSNRRRRRRDVNKIGNERRRNDKYGIDGDKTITSSKSMNVNNSTKHEISTARVEYPRVPTINDNNIRETKAVDTRLESNNGMSINQTGSKRLINLDRISHKQADTKRRREILKTPVDESNKPNPTNVTDTMYFSFLKRLTQGTRRNLLIFTSTISDMNAGDDHYLSNNIRASLNLIEDETNEPDTYHFYLLDLYETNDDQHNNNKLTTLKWRPIAKVERINETAENSMVVVKFPGNFRRWKVKNSPKQNQLFNEMHCNDEFCLNYLDFDLTAAQIVLLIVVSSLIFIAVIVSLAFVRYHILKNRLEKEPYKLILKANDFVFPTTTENRTIDEGIEAMLSCWLQQLQEFGGPEVDKPDLIKDPTAAIKNAPLTSTKGLSTSTGSLTKNEHFFYEDTRIRYNGDIVQVKDLPTAQNIFEVKNKAIDVLHVIHTLRHENLNTFIGCLVESPKAGLVYEWAPRGSLEDVLIMDEIKLDWSFRLSLLTDLVRGMRYLHASPVRYHGNLTSRNCVIDARWTLKITDFGLPMFYDAQNLSMPVRSARDLLWTAPEILRSNNSKRQGTQQGDIYSFGIIMQEVVVRGEPFCMLALTPEEIIEKIKRPPPLIRPSVSKGAAPPEAINIMRQCWAEQADMRPDFNEVYDLFKKLNHGRKVNFVDTIFQLLEKYSNNLEELIRERTEQLDMEKKKTEQLLNRMLPSTVAEKLKLGMPVDPEEFGEVTIYFSDIVGFTTISAHSTPFQVVDLLNDLYTCFDATINAYNVYKVETIGDAYMVVSGLPVRTPDHAEQIATMALDLLSQSGRFKIRHLPKTPLRLRIGLHSGPCCAGVVGLTMPRYCLFGDTVNTASRMESTGSAWRIHMSEATKDKLEQAGGYQIEYRGLIDIKGKGLMHTYWLLGKTGFDRTLPTPPDGFEDLLAKTPIKLEISNHRLSVNGKGDDTSSDSSFSLHPGQISPCVINIENNPLHPSGAGQVKVNVLHSHPTIQTPEEPKTVSDARFMAAPDRRVSLASCSNLNLSMAFKSSEIPTKDFLTSKSTRERQSLVNMPISASELAAALMGASSHGGGFKNLRTRRSVSTVLEESDLSSPYNHYRCLTSTDSRSSIGSDRPEVAKLRRQFSLDRCDETDKMTPKLSKQNSAGATNDLERIEEVPNASSLSFYKAKLMSKIHSSTSISVDSLSSQ